MSIESLSLSSQTENHKLSREQLMNLARDFQESHPHAMNVLDITGVSPFGSREMINPYTGILDAEDFSNVGRHCVAVAYAANKVAEKLGITDVEKSEIIEAALLHDGDKRIEVMRKKAKKTGVEIDVYSEAGYKTIENIFIDKGLDPSIFATIQTMGGMSGHNSLSKILILDDALRLSINPKRTLADLIVHISDSMTHSSLGKDEEVTEFVSFEGRSLFGNFRERYPFLWQEGIVISQNGVVGIKDIDTYVKTDDEVVMNYYDGMNIAFEIICEHIQNQIGASDGMSAIDRVLSVVRDTDSVGMIATDTGAAVHKLLY